MKRPFLPAMPKGFSCYEMEQIPLEPQNTGNSVALVRNGWLRVSPQYDFLYIQRGALPTSLQSSGAGLRRKKQG